MVRFEGYSVIRKAGAGGLADVYVAEVPLDAPPPAEGLLPGDRVALKILREPGRTEGSVARFLREGRLLMANPHPNLPRCYSAVAGERPYLALELLEGSTLKDLVREHGPLPHEVSLRMAETLLRVLSFLHERAIVHRDIKPANVFLTRDGRVLLLDLGLAADPSAASAEDLGDVMGTYAYMAPEQIAGAALDHRADLYSLGITLYECISGKRPYKANGPAGYLRAHTVGGADPLSRVRRDPIPVRLEELVGRLMCRDPAARPASASIALAILTGHLSVRQRLNAPPMVGRGAAIGALEAVMDGGGQVQVVGEPGMGLGQLASWLWEHARERGVTVIALRGAPPGGPLDPVRRLRARLAREEGPLASSREALAHALTQLASRQPTLLLLEHMEAASPVAQAEICTLPMVPGMAKVHFGFAPLEALGGRVITLPELSREEVSELVSGMLGATTPPPGLADKLHRFTGGLPAAVAWTLRDFYQRGTLRAGGIGEEGETRWSWSPQLRMVAENSLSVLFKSRLETLNEDERRLLRVLSVAREDLPLDLATDAAGVTVGLPAARRLHSMALARLREQQDGAWISVSRPALGALVAAGIGSDAARDINARLATALSRRPSDPWRDEHLPLFEAYGASAAQAAKAQVRIGEWLLAQGRYAQALEVLTRASHEPGLTGSVAARCALSRGQALLGLARPVEAMEALSAAAGLSRDQGRRDLVYKARVHQAETHLYLGDARRAVDGLDEVLRLGPDGPIAAKARWLRGKALVVLADLNEASSSYSAAMEQAQKVGDGDLLVLTQAGVAELYRLAGQIDDAIRLLEVGLPRLRTRRRRDALVTQLVALAQLRLCAGDLDAAVDKVHEAEEQASAADLPNLTAEASTARAAIHLACGDWEGASDLLRAVSWAGEAEADARLRVIWRALRVEARVALQDHNAALATCNELVEECGRQGWEAQRAFHAGLIAVLRGQGEDLAEALEALMAIGDHRGSTRLLMAASRLSGDASGLERALGQARRSGDRYLLLDALYALGGERAQREASGLARLLLAHARGGYGAMLRRKDAVLWALGAR